MTLGSAHSIVRNLELMIEIGSHGQIRESLIELLVLKLIYIVMSSHIPYGYLLIRWL